MLRTYIQSGTKLISNLIAPWLTLRPSSLLEYQSDWVWFFEYQKANQPGWYYFFDLHYRLRTCKRNLKEIVVVNLLVLAVDFLILSIKYK